MHKQDRKFVRHTEGTSPAPSIPSSELPKEVSDLDIAFGGIKGLMPDYAKIPDEFKRGTNKWCVWQAEWFYSGLKSAPKAKPGVDGKKAMRHLAAIQGSFEPKHEHKSASVAYLASRWFE